MATAFVIATCFLSIALGGCGTCKKDLEDAKAQIADLTGKNQKLSEGLQRLDAEKSSLTNEMTVLKDRYAALSMELAQVKKVLSNQTAKNEELRKNRAEIEAEMSKLKKENAELASEVTQFKKPAESVPGTPGGLPKTSAELHAKPATDSPETSPSAALTPCDALIGYMRGAGGVIERYKGEERESKIAELRAAYGGKMQDAPKGARETAEKWVQDAAKSWDQPDDDSMFRSLQLRNAVLNACGKSATEAGF